jgi:hypothetical protein
VLGVVCFWSHLACEDNGRSKPTDWSAVNGGNMQHPVDGGTYAGVGDACDDEGAQVECGKVTEQHDDYLTCSMGFRTCTGGAWSECVGTRTTQKPLASAPGIRPLALGSAGTCPSGFDPCDPYCNQIIDAPGGFTAPPNLSNTPSGVTPLPTGIGNCTSLALTPSVSTLTVTSLSPLTVTPSGPVTFTLTAAPLGCADIPFVTTWAVDMLDRASMSTSIANSAGGKLVLAVPVAGNLKVTAFAHGLNVSRNIAVKVNVLAAPTTGAQASALSTPANAFTSAANIALFGTSAAPLPGAGTSTAFWLYPYASTYFPLGLPAPVIQYRYTAGSGKAVKVSLRYPKATTPSTATFNYSIIVKESNVMSQSAGVTANTIDPQVVIPQSAWQYFEQTARGDDADLIVQRLQGSLEPEQARTIHFVDGQLKGTVFYNSYTSPQGGNTGAVLSIAPGASTPTLAVQPSGKCTVCHSLNLDGSTLIANGGRSTNSVQFNQSRRYNLKSVPTAASPAVMSDYNVTGGDTENASGDRYTFGAPWLDGSVYLTHGGLDTAGGDDNWRAPNDYSKFYRPATSVAISVTNWGSISGVTPRFSPDGQKLAFGFWGPTGSSLRCSSNAISPCVTSGSNKILSPVAPGTGVTGGTRLVVTDFIAPTNPASTTGWSVSNARDVTPGVTQKVAWPSFTPDGNSVVYQRQIRSSRAILSWSPSDINTVAGALAEIWMSKVPADGSTTVVPTRLSALNGLTSGSSSYLPQYARSTFPVDTYTMSQTVSSGSAGPAIGLTGISTAGPLDVRIDITTGATTLASTKFRYSLDGGATWVPSSGTNLTPTANYVLPSTGLTATFASTGVSYNVNSTYKALVGYVEINGTPTNGPLNVRIAISTIGALGASKFKYSTDGSVPASAAIFTGTNVPLGATGLTATFLSANYDSVSYNYYANVDDYPYHQNNASYTINQADYCGSSGTASAVNDYQLNYLPAVAPAEAAGYHWVVFTSRRMYGNVAADDPWDAEPNQSCNSGNPQTKKLWIAAVDKNWTPGTDPSHPAFYFPGQELEAGNSNGYWVNAQCTILGGTCSTDDDCCGGTGSSPTSQCSVVSTATVPPTKQCQSYDACSAVAESCATSSDCCTGLVCPNGGGDCVSLPSPVYEVQSLDREYVASCPRGTDVAWRFFEWQANIPTGTSIDFSVQTKQLATDTYAPAVSVAMASANSTTPAGTWVHGAQMADQVLAGAGITSDAYLRVTMTFNPNATGTTAPTLLNWRQIFDCLPAE